MEVYAEGYDEAQKAGAAAIILRLNTYGGTVVHADSIRTLILNSSMPVYALSITMLLLPGL